MDDTRGAMTTRPVPPHIEPLPDADLAMISRVRETLVDEID